MVQFKPTITGRWTEREKHRSNTYWMLGSLSDRSARDMRKDLEKRGYQCRKSATKTVLADSLGRLERGLLCYENCHAVELRRFCKSRGISSGATTVARLARKLEEADDYTSFPRLFELPPEIRLVIYEYHFNDYEAVTHKHHQPPLTLASGRLRLEALPIFYKCVKFEWHFKCHFINEFHRGDEKIPFSQDSCDLLLMPAASLSQIKNFSVQWTLIVSGRLQSWTMFEIKSYEHNGLVVPQEDPRQGSDASTQHVRGIVGSMLHDTGCSNSDWKLQLEHFDVFRAAGFQALFPRTHGSPGL
jgi:hypothetical protein